MFSRNTVGLDLQEQDRLTYFPSVPACCLVWVLEGEAGNALGVRPGALGTDVFAPMPAFAVAGPRSRPLVTKTIGDSRIFVLMLLPDAFHSITGREPGEYVNQILPAMGVLGDEWQVMSDAVRCASDDDARVRLVQDFLAPLWAEMRPTASFHGRLIQDWSHALSLRAATSGFGRSLRQVERRIKRWTGQPLRDLKGLVRMETAMLDAVLAIQQGEVNWAELAVASGFSDQAHLCRQIRLLTGFSPQELMRRAMHEEAFWFYRLWSGVPHVPAQGVDEPEEAARQPQVDIDSAVYSHRI